LRETKLETMPKESELLTALRGARTAITTAVAIISGISTIAGLGSASAVAAVNTLGVLAVFTMTFGGAAFYDGGDMSEKVRHACWATAVSGIVGFLIFLAGRGLDEAERQVNILTVMGGANLVFMGTLVVLAFQNVTGGVAPPEKTCPDCANTVLAAARKCQHCGYRFAKPPAT
jgi:hypothetical protein